MSDHMTVVIWSPLST